MTNAIVVAATALTVALAVVLHYEGLSLLGTRMPGRAHRRGRRAVLIVIFWVLALHVVEIWLFGVSYWLLMSHTDSSIVAGGHAAGLLDAVYLSATTYTTVGFGIWCRLARSASSPAPRH